MNLIMNRLVEVGERLGCNALPFSLSPTLCLLCFNLPRISHRVHTLLSSCNQDLRLHREAILRKGNAVGYDVAISNPPSSLSLAKFGRQSVFGMEFRSFPMTSETHLVYILNRVSLPFVSLLLHDSTVLLTTVRVLDDCRQLLHH